MPETGWEAAELLQRADPNSRARAAQKLQQEDFGAELSRALEDRVFDPDPEVRALATFLLLSLRESASPDLLFSALEDTSPDVVAAAAEALASLKPPRAADALTECLASRPGLAGPLALAMAKLEDPGVEELLLDWTGQEESAVRIAVLRALGASGTERSVPELKRLLSHGDGVVEAEALAALARIRERVPNAVGRDQVPAEAAKRIAGLLRSEDRHALLTAVSLIGWVHPAEGAAWLLELLAVPDAAVRERAREVFGSAAAGEEGSALESIAAAAERNPAAAAAALDLVAKVRDERSCAISIRLLRSPDPKIRERAAGLLGRSGGAGVPEALLALAEDPVGHVRAQAAQSLGLLRHGPAGSSLEALLSDPYPDVRAAALAALSAIRGHEVDVIRLFGRARDGAARAAALRASDPRRSGELFRAAVSDPDPDVRLAAAASLNERGVWLEEAAALLADEDPRVRSHAVRARLASTPALPLDTLQAFLHDPDPGVRLTLALGLERASGIERVAWLRRLLRDPCEAVGRAAARALANHHDPETLGALLDAVSSAPGPVAAVAIDSLGALADPEALPRLRAVARGGHPSLRGPASRAVRRVEASRP